MRPFSWVLLAGVVLAGCSAGSQSDGQPVIFAASSLVDVLSELSAEEAMPFSDVTLSFASSASLAAQIIDDAPVDVFISADRAQIERLRRAGFSDTQPKVVARNSLVIAVEAGNPLGLAELRDLSRGDVLVAIAAPGVPLGEYSQGMLSAANIEVRPVTFEADARGVLAKVALGEVDAGIVYATDAASASNVDRVVIPEAEAVNVEYVALDLTGGSGAGQDLIEFLTSDTGRFALTNRGFLLP
ncbi:MAG: molybdate ABC transporter substrate-binding protein [Ilumatobacteraceae bacterium]|nr:molybdate ABC transporter substrate-binding protein [Ilumatobacteraceae bacterium]